jgi:UPF0271 protein
MRRTVELALRHGAAIGAHPGFADRENFGRRELSLPPGEAGALVVGQVAALERIASEFGARVRHVKLHGALYAMASREAALAAEIVGALAAAMRAAGTSWSLVGLAGSRFISEGRERGLTMVGEAFADRSYRADGSLAPRSEAGSVIADPEAAVRQALRIALEGFVEAADGSRVSIDADTICIHGDGPHAAAFARRIRSEFAAAGVAVRGSP